MAERQGLEVWGYRMCMKDRMRRFLVDVLDIHNKDVIEEVIGISSIRHCPKGRTLYSQGETVDTCCFLMEGVTVHFSTRRAESRFQMIFLLYPAR